MSVSVQCLKPAITTDDENLALPPFMVHLEAKLCLFFQLHLDAKDDLERLLLLFQPPPLLHHEKEDQ